MAILPSKNQRNLEMVAMTDLMMKNSSFLHAALFYQDTACPDLTMPEVKIGTIRYRLLYINGWIDEEKS